MICTVVDDTLSDLALIIKHALQQYNVNFQESLMFLISIMNLKEGIADILAVGLSQDVAHTDLHAI